YAAAIGYAVVSSCCLSVALYQNAYGIAAAAILIVNLILGIVTVSAAIHDLRPRARRQGPQVRTVNRAPLPLAVVKSLAARSAGPTTNKPNTPGTPADPPRIPNRAPLPLPGPLDQFRRS